MKKREYQAGEKVGDNGFLFVKEIEPRINKKTEKISCRRAIFICPICHQQVAMDIGPVKRNRTKMCRKCADKIRGEKQKEKFNTGDYIKDTRIIFIKELGWQNGHRKISAICPVCGKEFVAFLDNIKRHHTVCCLACSRKRNNRQSLGEKRIAELLTELKINFYTEFTFNDCKSKRVLPFDFYLPKYNTCIEVDGKQHDVSIDFFGGDKAFYATKYRDHIKNLYCEDNHIGLLRISSSDVNKITKEQLLFFIKNNQGHFMLCNNTTYTFLQRFIEFPVEEDAEQYYDSATELEIMKSIYHQK